MGNVWALSERVDEGILPDIGLGNLAMETSSVVPGGMGCSHSHDLIEEICMFKAGTGRIQIEDGYFDVGPDSVAVINSGEFHEIVNTGRVNLEYVSFFNTNVDLTAVRLKTREQHFNDYGAPSYAGMLGKIVVGETRSAAAFECWAEATADVKLSKILRTAALRSEMHAGAFKKRLNELGCPVESDLGTKFEAQMQVYEGDASDLDKLRFFGADQGVFDDPFVALFADRTIDPMTGCLLGRYIAEGRDSIRLMQEYYLALSRPNIDTARPGVDIAGRSPASGDGPAQRSDRVF